MRRVTEYWSDPHQSPPVIMIHALRENKRPIGFAPWPEEELRDSAKIEFPDRRKKKRRKKK